MISEYLYVKKWFLFGLFICLSAAVPAIYAPKTRRWSIKCYEVLTAGHQPVI